MLLKIFNNFSPRKWLISNQMRKCPRKTREKSRKNIWKFHFFTVTLHPQSGKNKLETVVLIAAN